MMHGDKRIQRANISYDHDYGIIEREREREGASGEGYPFEEHLILLLLDTKFQYLILTTVIYKVARVK